MYIDPANNPGSFVLAALERWPQTHGGTTRRDRAAGVMSIQGRSAELAAIGVAVVLLALFVWMLIPTLKRKPNARFWALAAALAAIPVCATQPQSRLMLIGGLGTAGLVAHFHRRSDRRYGPTTRGETGRRLLVCDARVSCRLSGCPFEAWEHHDDRSAERSCVQQRA